MAEFELVQKGDWDAGFVAGSQVVVSRLGPYQKVFLRPEHYRRSFFHKVYDLAIEDWSVPPLVRVLAGVCRVEVGFSVRFQPGLAYARAHPEYLPDVGSQIRTHFQPVIHDQAERMLRQLEDAEWLQQGCEPMERQLEDSVQVAFAVHNLRCRCRCHIHMSFQDIASKEQLSPAGTRLREHYLTILRNHEAEEANLQRQRMEREEDARRVELSHQAKLLEMARQAREMERQTQQEMTAELNEKLSAEEARLQEARDSEARRLHAQMRHDEELRQLRLAAEQQDLQQRLTTLGEKDDCLQRELEQLYLEKQRLLLQEEIQGIKQLGLDLN